VHDSLEEVHFRSFKLLSLLTVFSEEVSPYFVNPMRDKLLGRVLYRLAFSDSRLRESHHLCPYIILKAIEDI